jgi:Domain of unknown function (DUF4389)
MSTPAAHPVRLVGGDELARSRLTVLVRIFLLIPHVVVLALYGIAAFVVVIIAWFIAVFSGRVPDGMHDFIAGYVRYSARIHAYGGILADPFPPFGGSGEYPVDLEIDGPVPQNRLTVLFRLVLVLPCYLLVGYVLNPLFWIVAIISWFAALFTGREPQGLQNFGMTLLRFISRTTAYYLLVTARYPSFSGDSTASLPADQGSLPPIP